MKKAEIEKKIIPIVSQEVGLVQYPYDVSKEVEFIKNLKYEHNDPAERDEDSKSTHTNVKISLDKFVLNRPELKKLYEFCQDQVDSYVEKVLHSPAKLKINSSWIAMNETGSKTEPHIHSSVVNGCFYVNVPDDTTPLVLNVHNCLDVRQFFEIPIKCKDLVLWDNQLSHWVPENKNKETRYCLAFNTSLKEQFDFSLALAEAYKNPNSPIRDIKNHKGEAPAQGVLPNEYND